MRHLFLLFLLLANSWLFAQNADSLLWLKNFRADRTAINSPISIYVGNYTSNETLLDYNGELSIVPASTLKLVTSAAALEILGNQYTFKTKIAIKGTIKDSVLIGDLVIVGGGDPSLGSDYLFGTNKSGFLISWCQKLKQAGIKQINGNIVVDPGIYSDQDVPQTWIWEDLGNYFGASAQGVSVYDNMFRIVFETENYDGGQTQIIGTEPYIPNLEFNNQVLASDDRRDRAYVFGSPFDSFRTIKGTLPKGRENFKIKASIPDPSLQLGFELQKVIMYKNIETTGNVVSLKNKPSISTDSTLFVWESPTLDKIVQQLNYESINLFAEHLCKHIGLVEQGEGSTKAGVKAIKRFWTAKGIDTNFMFLSDGSGLSRANAISAKTLVQILAYMQNESEYTEAFIKSIPTTGLQGTQKYYFQQSFLKGKAQAKSGSMTRVRSFAGYMTTAKGTPISFAIIVNNFDCSSFTMATKMEKLMEGFYIDF